MDYWKKVSTSFLFPMFFGGSVVAKGERNVRVADLAQKDSAHQGKLRDATGTVCFNAAPQTPWPHNDSGKGDAEHSRFGWFPR